MKSQIKLDYNNKVYISDSTEVTQEDILKIKELIKEVTQGKVTHLSIEIGNQEYYFTKYILEKSIISVIIT